MLLAGAPADAGVIDSPIPLVNGQKVKSVYVVAGVTADTNGFETQFLCSSLDTKDMTIAVEVFDDVGGEALNDVTVGNGVQVLGIGRTVTIETNDIASFASDEKIDLVKANSGSARILSTSSKFACTAIVVGGATLTPPTSMANLTIIKKSQKGD